MSLLSAPALAEKPFFVNLAGSLDREAFAQDCAEESGEGREGSPAPAVRSVVRAVELLKALNRRPVSTVEFLHAQTRLPKPSIVRMMQTLEGCGLVKHWEQLVICRLLEGMAEAAYISGAAYLIGAYYTKSEYLTRFVFFSTAGIIAGAVNGFLSTLIAKMNGTGGYAAWRWSVPLPCPSNVISDVCS